MSSRRNTYLVVAVVAIIIIAGVGVGLYLTAPSPGPTPIPNQGKIIVDDIGDAQFMDPATDYETAGGEILQNCYETLLFYNMTSASQLLPVLCENYTVNGPGTVYTFNLRHGITFTDGTAFNASVMKWSLDRAILINDPTGPAWIIAQFIRGGWTYLTASQKNRTVIYQAAQNYLKAGGVEITGPYQITINVDYMDSGSSTPYAAVPYCLAFTVASAVSYTYVDINEGHAADISADPNAMSFAQWNATYNGGPSPATLPYDQGRGVVPDRYDHTGDEYMDDHVCGTGPFMLTEWTHSVRMVMDRNPNYWGGPHNTGIAPISEVIINVVLDYNTRKLDILAGTADVIAWPASYAGDVIDLGTRATLPAYASTIRTFPDLPTFNIEQLQFNEFRYLPSGVTGVINCKGVNGSLVGTDTYGNPKNASLNPFSYVDFRQAFVDSFDFAAYYAALNGFMVHLNGFIPAGMVCYSSLIPYQSQDLTTARQLFFKVNWTGSINLYYNTGSVGRNTACLILHDAVQSATEGKVTINVDSLTWPQYLGLMQKKVIPIGDIGWLPDYADPDDYAVPYAETGGTFSGVIGYSNATVDSEVATAAASTSTVIRTGLYQDVDFTLYKQAVYLWLGQPSGFHVERTWIHGYMYNPCFSGLMYYYMSKY